jgi:hypothetical protein
VHGRVQDTPTHDHTLRVDLLIREPETCAPQRSSG